MTRARARHIVRSSFAALGHAAKYTYPRTPDVDFGDQIILKQPKKEDSEGVFYLVGLRRTEMKYDKYLKGRLRFHAPKDTTLMSRRFEVIPLDMTKQRQGWALVIYNKVSYFKFPFHYYLKKGRNFIADACRDLVFRQIKPERRGE